MAESISGYNQTQRKDWVDAVRGLAILLVVIGHANSATYPFFLLTSPIKMPLFFVVSGYLFNSRGGSFSAFFKNLFIHLIIPWLFLGLFPILCMIPFKGFEVFTQYLLKMVSGESIWFMPCFIIGEVFFFSILKYLGKKEYEVVIASLVLFILGYLLIQNRILDYAMINRAMTVQFFFALGWLFKRFESSLLIPKVIVVFCGAIVFVLALLINIHFYPGTAIDVHMGEYLNPVVSLIQIAVGCWLVFVIAKTIKQYPRWSTQFGKDSLLIYIWSPYIMLAVLRCIGKVSPVSENFWWLSLVAIFTCCICCVVAIPINIFAPILVGKRKRYGK